MEVITTRLGELLKLPEPAARYLLALFIAYIFAVVYRVVLKKTSSTVQSIYFTVTGIWTLYFVFGFSIWHFTLDIAAVYMFVVVLGPTLVTVTLTWILTLGHLLIGYYIVAMSNKVHPIFWTIPHCVLVLKLIGLTFNLYDGRKKKESLSADQMATRLTSTPTFIDMMGFCYHFGTVLAGPQFSFKRYQDFVSGKLFDWSKTRGSASAGAQRMLLGVFMSLLYAFLNSHFPQKYIFSEDFKDHSLILKLFHVVVISNLALRKLLAVWILAEGACIVTGISYNGKNSNNTDDWSGINNVKIQQFELCTTLKGVTESFNVNTNNWVKCYVYKRLKWMGSRDLSMIISLAFLTLWHGIWVGYALNFSLEFLDNLMEKQVKVVLVKRFGLSLHIMHWVYYIPSVVVMYVLKSIVMSYPVMLFTLLSWEACYEFSKSVYFYGHILPVVWFIAYYTFLKPPKDKKV